MMDEPSDTPEQRRLGRAAWPVKKATLATMTEATAEHATALQRFDMVGKLSVSAYALAGIAQEGLPRSQWPSRIIRPPAS